MLSSRTGSAPYKHNLQKCGKSKSCEEESSSSNSVVYRNTKRAELEAKRRSVYLKECKGRSGTQKSCTKCIDVAKEVNDLELNNEIFHIPTPTLKSAKTEDNLEGVLTPNVSKQSNKESTENVATSSKIDAPNSYTEKESLIHINVVPEDFDIAPNLRTEEEIVESNDKEKLIQLKSPKHSRKFDTVKTLLEKARQKLLKLSGPPKNLRKGEKGINSSSPKENRKFREHPSEKSRLREHTDYNDKVLSSDPKPKHSDEVPCCQSSPVTPAEVRRKYPKIRNRSFSPVRYVPFFANS